MGLQWPPDVMPKGRQRDGSWLQAVNADLLASGSPRAPPAHSQHLCLSGLWNRTDRWNLDKSRSQSWDKSPFTEWGTDALKTSAWAPNGAYLPTQRVGLLCIPWDRGVIPAPTGQRCAGNAAPRTEPPFESSNPPWKAPSFPYHLIFSLWVRMFKSDANLHTVSLIKIHSALWNPQIKVLCECNALHFQEESGKIKKFHSPVCILGRLEGSGTEVRSRICSDVDIQL